MNFPWTVFLVVVTVSATPERSRRQTEEKDCGLTRDAGLGCENGTSGLRFYFDKLRGVCQPFMYRGCGGNGNRFESAAECKEYCIEGEGADRLQAIRAMTENPMKAACKSDYATDHLTPKPCQNVSTCGEGYECNGGFCCPTSQHLCTLTYDAGKFAVGGEKSDRYFYSTKYNFCMRFSFYGALGNENNFYDFNSCNRTCSGITV